MCLPWTTLRVAVRTHSVPVGSESAHPLLQRPKPRLNSPDFFKKPPHINLAEIGRFSVVIPIQIFTMGNMPSSNPTSLHKSKLFWLFFLQIPSNQFFKTL